MNKKNMLRESASCWSILRMKEDFGMESDSLKPTSVFEGN